MVLLKLLRLVLAMLDVFVYVYIRIKAQRRIIPQHWFSVLPDQNIPASLSVGSQTLMKTYLESVPVKRQHFLELNLGYNSTV